MVSEGAVLRKGRQHDSNAEQGDSQQGAAIRYGIHDVQALVQTWTARWPTLSWFLRLHNQVSALFHQSIDRLKMAQAHFWTPSATPTGLGPQHIGQLETTTQAGGCNPHGHIFPGQELVIGHGPDCHFRLDDATVHDQHLRILVVPNITEPDKPPFVVAEALCDDCFWEDVWYGKGQKVLLTHHDNFRLGKYTKLHFRSLVRWAHWDFSEIVQKEMEILSMYLLLDRKLPPCGTGKTSLAVRREDINRRCKAVQVTHRLVNLETLNRKDWGQVRKELSTTAGLVKVDQEQQRSGETWDTFLAKRRCVSTTKLLREADVAVSILRTVSHPHIVRLERLYKTDESLHVFQEFMLGGFLPTYLAYKGGRLDETEAGVIVHQVAEAIHYLHTKSIANRNIQPENVFVDFSSQVPRIILLRFGGALRLSRGGRDHYKGSPFATDMWSLGCIATVVLTGKAPFGFGADDGLAKLRQSTIISDAAKSFVAGLLMPNEDTRMLAHEALEHQWLGGESIKSAAKAARERILEGLVRDPQFLPPDVVVPIHGHYTPREVIHS